MKSSLEERFEIFYRNSFKGVFRFFYYKSVDLQSIEELCQEVYMRFWKNYKAYLEDFAQSKKIIYGIALNVYREWVRSSLKNETLCVDDFWEQLATEEQISSIDPWLNSDYEKQHQKLKKRLKIAISQLPEKQKLVLEYRFLRRLTRKETAARMNTTEDNVYTYQKRAIKALKQIVNSVNNLENTDTT